MTERADIKRIFGGVGQDHLYRRVEHICRKERVGSAYLFSGPRGAGKMHLALHFFAALNCLNPLENGSACGKCDACAKIRKFNHPNLHLIYALPGSAGNNRKVVDPVSLLNEKQFKELQLALNAFYEDPYEGITIPGANRILLNSVRTVKKELSLKSSEPGWQFVLIQRVEQTGSESFNSLLKILEEPPANCSFILTTEKLNEVPDTIKSRCQLMKFNPVNESDIISHLCSQGVNDNDARLISHLANGNMQKIRQYRSSEFEKDKESFLGIWRSIMRDEMLKVAEQVKELSRTAKTDRNAFEDFFRMMIYWFIDAQGMEAGSDADRLILFQFRDEMGKFTQYYPAVDYYRLILQAEQVIELSAKNVYIPALVSHFFVTVRQELQQARMRI